MKLDYKLLFTGIATPLAADTAFYTFFRNRKSDCRTEQRGIKQEALSVVDGIIPEGNQKTNTRALTLKYPTAVVATVDYMVIRS